jgi:hypothetical protein
VILAIVGTRVLASRKARQYAEILILHEVIGGGWTSFVTGDATGIDAMAKRICDEAVRACQALKPETRKWEPDGYKARNIKIANIADQMLCIRHPGSSTYGSGWTANYMESLGKPVTRVLIS